MLVNRKNLNSSTKRKIPVLKNFTYSFGKSNYSPLWTFILYILFFHADLQAQTYAQKQDSIAQIFIDSLSLVRDNAQRIHLFNEISWTLKSSSPEKAISFARSAVTLAKKTGDQKQLATAYNRLGIVEGKRSEFRKAIIYYDSALVIEEATSNQSGIARASNQLAAAYRSIGSPYEAITYSKRAVKSLEVLDKQKNLATALVVMANTYKDLAKYDSSLIYLNRSLDIRTEIKDTVGIAQSLLGLGSLYDVMNNHPKSLEFNKKSFRLYESLKRRAQMAKALTNIGNAHLGMDQSDSAETSYLMSLQLKLQLGDSIGIAPGYNNLGKVYELRGEYVKAQKFITKAVGIYRKYEDPRLLESYFNLGNLARFQSKNTLALTYYFEALKMTDSLQSIKRHPHILKAISEVYTKTNQFEEAIKYENRYSEVQQEITADQIRLGNLELAIQEERSKSRFLQSEQDRQKLALDKQRIIIASLAGAIVLLALLFFTILRISRLRAKNELIKKNEDLQQQRIKELIREKELEAINAMVEGQESERLRIARDLHDRLGGTLSIVKMHFKSVEESIEDLKEKNVKQYKEANNLLDEACDEVRKIAHDMASGVLMKFGLIPALNALKETVETAGQLKLNLIDIGLEERLSYHYEINIYRVIQELLTNTLKHAKAKEMSVQLFRKEESLSIVVEDDGRGFDPDDKTVAEGIGLKNIESRVYKFDGEMTIDSGKGAGTTITIDLPLNEDKL